MAGKIMYKATVFLRNNFKLIHNMLGRTLIIDVRNEGMVGFN